eukprot:CAMPEP_0179256056 /NCGR_PEP_ID=MMETSP0797-20121207/24069_1 /TAXON_ID=47934 /ORGANISM="Dinophysis acuminata, Strain DAEP01" /LENGTH=220 /DNA_ID=CAMNT_0020963977 /DNA_START=203 /DNA_END=864 /DNA_ORIENTATION=+
MMAMSSSLWRCCGAGAEIRGTAVPFLPPSSLMVFGLLLLLASSTRVAAALARDYNAAGPRTAQHRSPQVGAVFGPEPHAQRSTTMVVRRAPIFPGGASCCCCNLPAWCFPVSAQRCTSPEEYARSRCTFICVPTSSLMAFGLLGGIRVAVILFTASTSSARDAAPLAPELLRWGRCSAQSHMPSDQRQWSFDGRPHPAAAQVAVAAPGLRGASQWQRSDV